MVSIERLGKKTFLLLAAEFSLAICIIYSLFYLAKGLGLHYFVLSNRGMLKETIGRSLLSGPFDIAVWGIAVLVCLFWLGYKLGLNNVRHYYRSFSALGALVLLAGLAVVVCLVVFGLVVIWSLVLISSLLFALCFVLAPDLFGVGRLVLFLRVLFGGLLIVFFVE